MVEFNEKAKKENRSIRKLPSLRIVRAWCRAFVNSYAIFYIIFRVLTSVLVNRHLIEIQKTTIEKQVKLASEWHVRFCYKAQFI